MTADRKASFRGDLLAIVQDPQVRALALRRARDPYVAEDALQAAYYDVARVPNPEAIRDLRAYFCRVLIRNVSRFLGQLGAAVVDFGDIAALSDRGERLLLPSGNVASAEFESEVHGLLLAEALLTRFKHEQHELIYSVPARSSDPGRYRAAIVAAAGKILGMLVEGVVTEEDLTAILRSGYPEWYAESDVPHDVSIRRLRRAREDVRTLLQPFARQEDDLRHVPGGRLIRTLQAPLYVIHPPDERVRTADAALTALFLKAEQTVLPDEMPYDLEQGLQMFTGWLDHQP